MRTTLLLACTVALVPLASAQPILETSFYPMVGVTVQFDVNDVNAIDPGDAGADITWNFSDLEPTSTGSYTFMDPADTPFADLFPQTNLAAQQPDETYYYYRSQASGILTTGFAKDDEDLGLIALDLATNPERIISVPFTFDDSENDTFAGTQEALGLELEVTGTKSISADAWGTLILPNGMYMNTIRLRESRSQAAGGFTSESIIYRWVSPDQVFWLLELGENTNSTGGVDYLNRWARNPINVGIADGTMESNGFNVLNNAVRSGDPIRIWTWEPVTGALRFTDMNGRIISEQDRLTLGREGMELPTAGLASGVYMITFVSNGKAQTERLVIQ